MLIETLFVSREGWGVNKGNLKGTIKFVNGSGEIQVNLDHEVCKKMLVLVAEAVAAHSQKLGKMLTADVLDAVEAVPQLEE